MKGDQLLENLFDDKQQLIWKLTSCLVHYKLICFWKKTRAYDTAYHVPHEKCGSYAGKTGQFLHLKGAEIHAPSSSLRSCILQPPGLNLHRNHQRSRIRNSGISSRNRFSYIQVIPHRVLWTDKSPVSSFVERTLSANSGFQLWPHITITWGESVI